MSTADAIDSQPPYQPKTPPKDPWGYASSPEMFPSVGGIVDGRDAAIEEGRENYEEAFYVAPLRPISFWHHMPESEDLLEQMSERSNAEEGSDWPDVSKEARAELDGLLKAWCEKHDTRDFYEQAGEAERIEVAP